MSLRTFAQFSVLAQGNGDELPSIASVCKSGVLNQINQFLGTLPIVQMVENAKRWKLSLQTKRISTVCQFRLINIFQEVKEVTTECNSDVDKEDTQEEHDASELREDDEEVETEQKRLDLLKGDKKDLLIGMSNSNLSL